MITFTEAEVLEIIGDQIDVKAKYEADSLEDVFLDYDDDDSDEIFGEKLACYANQISDVSTNLLKQGMIKQLTAIKRHKLSRKLIKG